MRSSRLLLLYIMAVLTLAGRAHAAETWVDGRVYYGSSSYYTNTLGDFVVSFTDELPYGSSVRVRFGFGGTTYDPDWDGVHMVNVDWQNVHEVEMPAVAPWTWSASFKETLHERGQPQNLTKLQFVLIVRRPDGSETFVKGNDSGLGYYEVALPAPHGSGEDPGALNRLRLTSVVKD